MNKSFALKFIVLNINENEECNNNKYTDKNKININTILFNEDIMITGNIIILKSEYIKLKKVSGSTN